MSEVSIESVLQQMRALSAQAAGGAGAAGGPAESGFTSVLEQALAEVNARQQTARQLAEAYERQDPSVSLTDVMVSMQKSTIAFQAALQVRNKLLAAYQEIMSMQI